MNLAEYLLHPVFKCVSDVAAESGQRAFPIGGYVRDLILNRSSKDIDFVTEGSGIEFAHAVAARLGGVNVNYFKSFGTAQFVVDGVEVEFVGARKESYRRESRKPIVEEGTLEDDQNRRDFTINALAIDLNPDRFGQVIDPFSGLHDLKDGIIRTPLDPDITYSDDPLRMLRAIRFAAQLGFTIEQASFASIQKNAKRITIISAERIATELNKIVLSPAPSVGFKLLMDSGLLKIIFPEMHALKGVEVRNGIAHKDNFYHTLQVLDNVACASDNLWLRWAAIMHDIAKPPTKRFDPEVGWTFHGHEDKGARMVPKIFRRMRLPLDHQMQYVKKLVFLHLRPIALTKESITDSAVRRLLFEAGDDIDDLMVLCRADITSKNDRKVKRYLENYEVVKRKLVEVEEKDRIRNFQPPVTGETIMETFGIGPSRAIGEIKAAIKEAILEGDIPNTREAAFDLMLKVGAEMGLRKS